jgi:hypothetical protein
MDLAARLTPGAVRLEFAAADPVHHAFGDDRSAELCVHKNKTL